PSTYLAVGGIIYRTDPTRCGHGTTSTPTTTTPTTTLSPAKSLDCNFDSVDYCNWKNHTNFHLGTVNALLDDNVKYPPTGDHTRNSQYGQFAYTSAKDYRIDGYLSGENPYPNQQICFQFFYYFYSMTLSNFYVTMDNGASQVPVFRAYGANEYKWRRVAISIKPNGTR